jgi:hypothetical protein
MFGFGYGRGMGFGRGAGYGRGWGGGFGFGNGWGYGLRYWDDFADYPPFGDEKEWLARYLDRLELHQRDLQTEIDSVKKRISDLEK